MKRVIAFVFLGLLIYAGGFVIYYAAVDLRLNNSVPVDLEYIQPQNINTGLVAGGNVYQVIEEVYTKKHQPTLFGIPFGETVTQHFYALPLGTSGKFMLISASDEKDIEALELLKTDKPRERGKNDPVLEVYGVMEETAPLENKRLKEFFLYDRPELIGYSADYPYRLETVADNHVVPFTFYIKHLRGADYVPLIVGIAMCVVGLGLAALLIFKIKREREDY